MQAGVDRTGQTSVHFVMPHHCKGGGVGASDGQRGPQSRGCCRQTEAGCYVLRLDWQGIVSQREKKKKKEKRSQPRASMPGGLPKMGLSPGVELVPGVGPSLRGVGVLDLRPGVEDLSFCGRKERAATITILQKQALQTDNLRANQM